jgi:membrane protein implicated in regulation of membrane protease activity
MIIMFVLMLLPILAIPVFWYLPLGQAVIVYLLLLLLSGWMFWLMRSNRKRPVVTGKESLVGRDAEIIAISQNGSRVRYTVRVEGELWTGRSHDAMQPGEKVIITASAGNTLIVKLKDNTHEKPE